MSDNHRIDINETIAGILNEDNHILVRALMLYKFQISIMLSKESKQFIQHQFKLIVPASIFHKLWISAAAILFIHGKPSSAVTSWPPRPAQSYANDESIALFQHFGHHCGWQFLLDAVNHPALHKKFESVAREASDAAKAFAISIRLEMQDEVAGWNNRAKTKAINILDDLKDRKLKDRNENLEPFITYYATSTIWNLHKRYERVAPFIYFAKFLDDKRFSAPNLTNPSFAKRLIAVVSDRPALIEAFNHVNFLAGHLRARHYQLHGIVHPHLSGQKFTIPKLPDSIV